MDMKVEGGETGSAKLAGILAKMNDQGGFSVSILTDQHGFPIACSSSVEADSSRQSAVVAMVQRTAGYAAEHLRMSATDEIRMADVGGQVLVCRLFEANGHPLILAVLIPDRTKPNRRLTNEAMSAIRRSWRL